MWKIFDAHSQDFLTLKNIPENTYANVFQGNVFHCGSSNPMNEYLTKPK